MLRKIINKSSLNNPYFLSSTQILNTLINILIISLITKYYSYSTLGLITFSQSIGGIFTALITECFDQLIILKLTQEKHKLSEILSLTIISRLVILIPIIMMSYIFIYFKTKLFFLGFIMISESLKSIIPSTIIDKYKETYNLVLISILERGLIFICIIVLLNNNQENTNIIYLVFTLPGLFFTILTLLLVQYKIEKIYLFKKSKIIFNEIITAMRGAPNVLSKISFLYYAKFLMGINGLYDDLGKLSVIHKIANVCVMPLSYFFRLQYGEIIGATKEMTRKLNLNLDFNVNHSIDNILKKGFLISLLNLITLTFIINNQYLIKKFPEILAIENIKFPCLVLFLYLAIVKFEQVFEIIFIGVYGRRKLLKFYLPGSLISIVTLSTFGINFNLLTIICCVFTGHASNSIRLISNIKNKLKTNYLSK